MCVISFQGLCLFQPDGGRVLVHLPAANLVGERHLDGDEAKPHRAGLWVLKKHAVEPTGVWCDAGDAWFFPLNGDEGEKYNLMVRGQGGRGPVVTELREELPHIFDFVPDLGDLTGDHVAAQVEILGGGFDYTRGEKYDWEVPVMRRGSGGHAPKDLGRVPWRVEWDVGAHPRTWVEILVLASEESPPVASVRVHASRKDPATVIVGNLDEHEAAKWGNRPNAKRREACGDSPHCPDNDFKWFYRLFNHGRVRDLLDESGLDKLPVPRLRTALSAADESGEPIAALDTPTCFPGTC